uniref:Phosphoenolpyruvate-protein phosphotransferase n=1 Tax=Thermosporothrix sp. COM3 TaxID=2490863 RepID=A0A455SWQ9_9CHLR|nr:phosphoenolpyruvate-protein phosphotransferase [Thermosporothrix sp. COM3]
MIQENDVTNPLSVVAISPGIAVGPALVHKVTARVITETTIAEDQVENELQRLHSALDLALKEIQKLSRHVAQNVGQEEAGIFEAHQMMLEDPDLLASVEELISQQHYSAEYALQQVAEQYAAQLAALDDELLSARSKDVKDAVNHVVQQLTGTASQKLAPTSPVIIVAEDLTPSDTASLDPSLILGICTVVGGPTTHAAILARTLEIPAVAGIDVALLDRLHEGDIVALDGAKGLFYQQLSAEQQQQFEATMQEQRRQRTERRAQEEQVWKSRLATTADDTRVAVFANVGDEETARTAALAGAEGIGLLRTEFLFGGRPVFPSEEEQFESYVALFKAFLENTELGKSIIVRTLDAGADKPFPALEPIIGELQEANPALGLRGIRIHLKHEELLRQQLRALLLAAGETGVDLHIMFPMIATVEEVRRVKQIYSAVHTEIVAAGKAVPTQVHLGIMVETPAAAIMAEELAREVDFFSIGANDLYQYTMAVDRTNSRVTGMFSTVEPAVLRMIARIAEAGQKYGKLVAVCGELGANPQVAPALVGMGVRELSMSPPSIARIKAVLHRQPLTYWQDLATKLLAAETAADIQQILAENE